MTIRAPRCPGCDLPPRLVLDRAAFCGNDDCQVLSWDRTADPATFKAKAVVIDIDLSPWEHAPTEPESGA